MISSQSRVGSSPIARSLVLAASVVAPVVAAAPVAAQAVATTSPLTGTVVDARTARPLSGVTVVVNGVVNGVVNRVLPGVVADGVAGVAAGGVTGVPEGTSIQGTDASAVTDANGHFAIGVPAGRYQVTAFTIGYALQRVTSVVTGAGDLPLRISLSEGAGSYAEQITVSGKPLERADAVPGAAALHSGELQSVRGVLLDDPLRAVQALPAATATDDFYSEFSVRGHTFRHINLTVDGMSTRYLMHAVNGVADGGSIAMVNSDTLSAVSLLPGSYPQKAGGRLGAEVDLTTREGSRERFAGRAGLSGTSANFLGEGPIGRGRGSWLVSVRRSYLDYLIKRIDPEASFAFGFYDGQAKIVYDVSPRHQLQLTTLLGRAVFDGGTEEQRGVNETAAATSHAWLSALSWRYAPGPRLSVTQRVYTTGIGYDNRNPAGGPLDLAGFADAGWRGDVSFAPSGRALVEFGGDALSLRGRRERTLTVRAGTPPVALGHYREGGGSASAYAQVRLRPTASWTITPGARLDHWSLTGAAEGSPWINTELRLDARTTLRLGRGIYRQFPEFEQVFGLNGGGRGLSAERAVHTDIGVERKLGRSTTVQVTGYARDESDVMWTPGSEPVRLPGGAISSGFIDRPWVNALEGHGRGVEILARRDSPLGLSGWVGYGYSRLRYTDTATGATFFADADQRHTVTVYGRYRISSRTTVGAKYRYGSNYPIVGNIGDAQAPLIPETGQPRFYTLIDRRNTLRLPPYARLDVRGDHAFNWSTRRLVLFVEIANVANHTNLRNVPYGIDRTGRVFDPTESLMPIVPSAGFVVEF